MCLGVPGLVVEVEELTALVDFWGAKRRVRLDLVDEPVAPGDYVLNHVGFAIRRIPPEDVQTTLELYEQLMQEANARDLMTADVRGEIAGTSKCPAAASNFAMRDARRRCVTRSRARRRGPPR